MDNELKHYGVLGMRWGHRRQQKRLARQKSRSKVIERINKNPEEGAKLFAFYCSRGEKATNRILDIMAKNPKKSLNSASDRQLGEDLAKKALIAIGAMALGSGLAAIK